MAQYDRIASAYRESKRLRFRTAIERFTLFETLGDVRGRTVLDLACGEGHYARLLLRAGATAVTGVDVSPGMIALAKAEERREPLGARYVRAGAADYRADEPADFVIAMFLLSYAGTKEKLVRFLEACHDSLKPGGRLVGFNDNVLRPPSGTESRRKYGFERTGPAVAMAGSPIRYRFYAADGSFFEFENVFLPPATWKEAFEEAGFPDLRWPIVRLDPEERGDPFWDDFLANPPIIGFTASRPAI